MSSRAATGGTRVTASSATQKVNTAAANAAFARQYAVYQRYLKTHPKAAAASKKRAATKAKRGAIGTVTPGFWITANNDREQTCATVAIANCVLMQTGKRATDAEVLVLRPGRNEKESLVDTVDQARAIVAALEARVEMRFPHLKALLAKLQVFVRADKAVVVGVLMQAAVALAAAMKFHLSAEGVAVVSTVINLGVAYFVNQNYKAKLAAAKLPKE